MFSFSNRGRGGDVRSSKGVEQNVRNKQREFEIKNRVMSLKKGEQEKDEEVKEQEGKPFEGELDSDTSEYLYTTLVSSIKQLVAEEDYYLEDEFAEDQLNDYASKIYDSVMDYVPEKYHNDVWDMFREDLIELAKSEIKKKTDVTLLDDDIRDIQERAGIVKKKIQ